MARADEQFEQVHPKTRAEWRRWLARHHETSPGVWVITWKKASGQTGPSYADCVEEALCFGWIDSRPQKIDEHRTALLYTPRKPKSGWAGTNKERVERLLAAGQMQPAGLAKIEAAKRDGSWDALTASEALEMPPELVAAFKRDRVARGHWDAFPAGVRKAILQWITSAKRDETRVKRIEETVTLAAQNVRANQWTPKDRRPGATPPA
ncbi:MAG: YdeI/OmpD-associated family protein [Chloroflexota bacterium]